MANKRLFILAHDTARRLASKLVQEAPQGTHVTFSDPIRNLEQNAKFHAMCNALANSELEWAGKRRSTEEWKVLLVSGHTVATKGEVEIVPGLENEFVNVREKTSTMSKKRASSLIEYTAAFCATHNVDCEVEFERLRRRGVL